MKIFEKKKLEQLPLGQKQKIHIYICSLNRRFVNGDDRVIKTEGLSKYGKRNGIVSKNVDEECVRVRPASFCHRRNSEECEERARGYLYTCVTLLLRGLCNTGEYSLNVFNIFFFLRGMGVRQHQIVCCLFWRDTTVWTNRIYRRLTGSFLSETSTTTTVEFIPWTRAVSLTGKNKFPCLFSEKKVLVDVCHRLVIQNKYL